MYQQLKRASMALTLSSVCFLAFAQKTIQGTVKDANGEPMIGVTITDQNGKAGGITDLDGKFTIQNADPNTVLTFSYIGCKPKKVKVGSQKTWNIVLEDDNAYHLNHATRALPDILYTIRDQSHRGFRIILPNARTPV